MIKHFTIMSKSKFFGYVLRNAGTPCQQWVLNEIPVSTNTVLTSTSTSEISVDGTIPASSILVNCAGVRTNTDGSFSLPSGLYRVTYSFIAETAAAGEVIVTLNAGATTVHTTEVATVADGVDGTISAQVIGDTVVKSTGCSVSWMLKNASTTSITPVLAGTESIRVIITKIA